MFKQTNQKGHLCQWMAVFLPKAQNPAGLWIPVSSEWETWNALNTKGSLPGWARNPQVGYPYLTLWIGFLWGVASTFWIQEAALRASQQPPRLGFGWRGSWAFPRLRTEILLLENGGRAGRTSPKQEAVCGKRRQVHRSYIREVLVLTLSTRHGTESSWPRCRLFPNVSP